MSNDSTTLYAIPQTHPRVTKTSYLEEPKYECPKTTCMYCLGFHKKRNDFK